MENGSRDITANIVPELQSFVGVLAELSTLENAQFIKEELTHFERMQHTQKNIVNALLQTLLLHAGIAIVGGFEMFCDKFLALTVGH